MARTMNSRLCLTVFAGVGYFLIARLSYAFLIEPEGIAPFWLGSGFSLAMLLLHDKTRWLAVLVGIFIACMIGNLMSDYALLTSFGLSAANLVEPVIGALLIQRFFPLATTLADPREVLGFFLAALICCTAGAVVGGTTVSLAYPGAEFTQIGSLWLADDILGILIVTPLILAFFQKEPGAPRPATDGKLKSWEFLLFFVLFLASCVFIFGRTTQNLLSLHSSPYWTLPFLIYSALRFRTRGAAIASLVLAISSVGLTILGTGPYAFADSSVGERVLALQFFLGVNIASILLLVSAINQSHRKQELLTESEKRLNDLVDQSPVGLALCRMDGSLVTVNSAYAKIIGYSPGEAAALSYWDITPEAYTAEEQKQLERLETTGRYGPYEKEYRHKNGHLVPVRLNGMIVVRDGERFIWSSVEDISALKEAQAKQEMLAEQLRQTQKMEAIGTLAGGVAHDFNNILAAIIGYTEMAMRAADCGEKTRQRLHAVMSATVRAKDLVAQILTFSRKGEGKLVPSEIHETVLDACNLLRKTLPSTIVLKVDIDPATGVVLADTNQIHQVVMNLCVNASHALPEQGGEIRVTLKSFRMTTEQRARYPELSPGDYARLIIRDNGSGIPDELVARIFEPFFTTKEVGKGTGIGLSVVYGIIQNHHGTIKLDTRLGEGTSFEILLPLSTEEADARDQGCQPEIDLRGSEHILFIDDEVALVELGKAMLDSYGYRVTGLTSAREAARLFYQNPDAFDLLITDQTMPELTGITLAKNIRHIRPDMPVMICSGYKESFTRKEADELNIKTLQKPLKSSELLFEIRSVLDAAQAAGRS